jgi:gamma-glutamylcyclotransferase (GGCT)/AIG2-like uncharacterized protein YtfP
LVTEAPETVTVELVSEKPDNKTHLVFVYGTLKNGFYNHYIVEQQEFLGKATTAYAAFSMLNLGTYPGVFARGYDIIHGELYRVNDSCFQTLMRLETPYGYEPQNTLVVTEDEEQHEAIMFVSAKPRQVYGIVPGGNWEGGDLSRDTSSS